MDVLKRNTDYALRAIAHLASKWQDEPVSNRDIAAAESISYQLTCKLLQKLARAKLVKSTMGAKGGFELSRAPKEISLCDVITAIQGPVNLNRCLPGNFKCPKKGNCPVRIKLQGLQDHIDDYFDDVTLADILAEHKKAARKGKRA